MSVKNSIGDRFGRLVIVGPSEKRGKMSLKSWPCKCDCGKIVVVMQGNLRGGYSRSCGCLNRELTSKASLRHGHSLNRKAVSRTYRTWVSMKSRCTNPNRKCYAHYGGRGIVVCDRWMNSFEAFLSDMGERPDETTLDRFPDVNGNYEPGNCRWATLLQQSRNTRRSRNVTWNGKTQCVSAWAEEVGIASQTLGSRLCNGWSIERAMTTPAKKSPKHTTQQVLPVLFKEADLSAV